MGKTITVVYLWRGERHVVLHTPATVAEANAIAAEMIADGWRAWVEVRA